MLFYKPPVLACKICKKCPALFHFFGNVLRSWILLQYTKLLCAFLRFTNFLLVHFVLLNNNICLLCCQKCSEYSLQPAIWVRHISSHRQEIIDLRSINYNIAFSASANSWIVVKLGKTILIAFDGLVDTWICIFNVSCPASPSISRR